MFLRDVGVQLSYETIDWIERAGREETESRVVKTVNQQNENGFVRYM